MREVIQEGVDGALADSKQDWVNSLSDLCQSGQKRAEMGAAAQAKVLRDYSLEAKSAELRKILENVTNETAQIAS